MKTALLSILMAAASLFLTACLDDDKHHPGDGHDHSHEHHDGDGHKH